MSQSAIQLLAPPASVPGGPTYDQLAYVDGYDAVLNIDYAFVAYKETDAGGDWRVRIKSSQTPGAVFEPSMMNRNARFIQSQGMSWFPWGYSFSPSAWDPRFIQFRVHVENGRPNSIEIVLQLRRFDGTPDTARAVRFAWPERESAAVPPGGSTVPAPAQGSSVRQGAATS